MMAKNGKCSIEIAARSAGQYWHIDVFKVNNLLSSL